MELVEGRTLEAMVRESGSLPFEDLIGIALQISDGLAEAHAHRIIHRDLKPGNVMVTKAGRVKLLDFGLAKPVEPADPGDGVGSADTTLSAELTRQGSVLGTLTGALVMMSIASGCNALGVSNSVQDIINGLIIIGAVTLDQVRQRRSAG